MWAKGIKPTFIVAAFAAFLAVGGCVGNFPTFAAAQGASAISTGKTVTDMVLSYASGKNCSTKRQEMGLTYCEEDEKNPTPNVYCYRTLGRVTCYAQPDPHRDGRSRVGDNSQNELGYGF